jgi:hypothetical protein
LSRQGDEGTVASTLAAGSARPAAPAASDPMQHHFTPIEQQLVNATSTH